MTHRFATAALLLAITMLVVPVSPSSAAPGQEGSSLAELQRRREQVRSEKAAQAGKVDALEATDAEVTSALQALNAQVEAQKDKVEEAERTLAKAEADRVAAEEAQAAAQAELDSLATDIKQSAVEAYVNVGSTDQVSTVGVEDMNEAVAKRMLLDSRAGESADLVEQFRSVQEDLELQRAAKAAAEQRAAEEREEVVARKAELEASHAEQQQFAAAVESRLDAALAEAAALADLDAGLSQQITAKQAEIARALEAQRKAEAARAAQRAAAQKAALTEAAKASSGNGGRAAPSSPSPSSPAPSSGGSGGGRGGSGGGGGGAAPAITGSGNIVSVGGIRVHSSIAGNLQSLLSAASAAGINFSGGGYRDPSGQIAVRKSNCGTSNYAIYQMPASSCRPPTARPGSSQHERGLAIDFVQNGSTLTRGSSGFAWLRANASRFGFYNLPAEPWHWSTTGR